MRLKLIVAFFIASSALALAQSVPPNFMTSLKFPTGRNMTNFDNWWNTKIRFFVDSPGVDIGAPPSGSYWVNYTDSLRGYITDQWYADLAGDTYGFNPEGAFLHQLAADYAPYSGEIMYAGDDFDIYEVPPGGYQRPYQAVNGVMNCTSGGSCTDVTRQAYCPDAPDTTDVNCNSFTAAPFQITDHLIVGKTIPYYKINITITSPQVGGSVAYKYWNGSSYVALGAGQSLTDTTNGLTQTGTISWVLPQGFAWTRNVDQGTRNKWHIVIQPTGVTTNATIGRLYGDNMTTAGNNRGYVCTGTPNNQGTELEYCPTPTAGSTALIPAEARLLTSYGLGAGQGNQLDYQAGKSSWAYFKMVQAEHLIQLAYPAHQNGIFWDNVGASPAGVDYTKTELGSTSLLAAGAIFFPRLYSVMKANHPTWWIVNNANHFSLQFPVSMQSDSAFCEQSMSGNWETTIDTDTALAVCPSRLWCSGSLYTIGTSITDSYSGYPDTSWSIGQYSGKTALMNFAEHQQLYAYADGSGSTLPSQWHRMDQDKSALGALAAFYTIKNPNTFFSYHADSYWSLSIVGLDEYYFWVPSTATLGVALTPQVCTSVAPCTLTLSGQLVTTTTPLPGAIDAVSTITTSQGPIRIGGAGGDVVDYVVSPGPYVYPTTVNPSLPIKANAITQSYIVGTSIEYMSRGFQADAGGVYQHPIGQWGMHIPASDINLGVPNPANGFGAPCRSDAREKPGVTTNPGYPNYPNQHGLADCVMDDGTLYSPNYPTLCDATGTTSTKGFCAQIVRRDFTGGQYGNAIVLWRPENISVDTHINTAGAEYDTLSNPIPLGGTYYALNTDGTINPTPVTTVQLKARWGFIGVSQPGATPNISSGVSISSGGVIR